MWGSSSSGGAAANVPSTPTNTAAALSQQQEATLKAVGELEIEMMSDMYRRMTASCHEK